jgi:hypothetical protein
MSPSAVVDFSQVFHGIVRFIKDYTETEDFTALGYIFEASKNPSPGLCSIALLCKCFEVREL